MKPAAFEYIAATDVAHALDVLERWGDRARPLAGGQSLMAEVNARLARPAALVDLNRIAGLDHVVEAGGGLSVGAMTRQRVVERHPAVRSACPLLADASRHIGSFQTRNRGTVGGSLAQADPSGELPAVAVALGATMVVEGSGGRRELPASDFFVGRRVTAMARAELLVEVRLPAWGARWAFEEITLRGRGGPAIVAVAVAAAPGPDRTWTRVGIGVAGAGPVPIEPVRAEALLSGHPITAELIAEAARLTAEDTEPETDMHATAAYRHALVEVLTRRALNAAHAG